jgi:threonine dehydratase
VASHREGCAVEPVFKDILLAQEKAKDVLHPSPLVRSSYFSRIFGSETLLKLENLQETGSFKVRGAYNRLCQLTPEEKQRGVIAASAGNHAQGVAWASTRLGIKASIVMPEDVSIRKLLAVKDYGAEIILHGTRFDQACDRGLEISRETGQVFIPAFADPLVIAGQGTVGLELSESVDQDTAIIVPVGGGGLISGIAIAAKALSPSVQVVGVQTRSCPSAIQSLQKGKPVSVEVNHTIADGIAVNRPGDLNFSLIQRLVDEMVDVDEEAIAGAILSLLDKANIVAEGAGAVPLAALMEGRISTRANRYILIVSGGNLEINTMDRILHRGSIKMGRLLRIEVDLLDVPGSLWKLMGIIAEQKANVLHVFHDRFNLESPIQISRVKLNLETRGHDHATDLLRKLREAGYNVKQTS